MKTQIVIIVKIISPAKRIEHLILKAQLRNSGAPFCLAVHLDTQECLKVSLCGVETYCTHKRKEILSSNLLNMTISHLE